MSTFAGLLLAPGAYMGWSFPKAAYPAFLLCCSGGLKKPVWAFGIGYGLCMLLGGWLTWTQVQGSPYFCCLYGCYGARLVVYLLRREISDAYNSSAHGREVNARMGKTKFTAKVIACLLAPLSQLATVFALQPLAGAELPAFCWLCLAVSVLGLLLEAAADEQKLAAKRDRPNEPVMTGAYSLVRHPNYLGEILFWLGIVSAGQVALPADFPRLSRVGYAFGPLLMIWIMFKAAKRLDKTAADKYKDHHMYQRYAARTSSLRPRFS